VDQVLRVHGDGGEILSVIKDMYKESMVCVGIGRKFGESLNWM
jgi:hypothetical protein